jgi:hypothetical protein
MSGIGSFFSSMFTTHADAPEDKPAPETEQPAEDASAEEAPKEEEKEEDEPEDVRVVLAPPGPILAGRDGYGEYTDRDLVYRPTPKSARHASRPPHARR